MAKPAHSTLAPAGEMPTLIEMLHFQHEQRSLEYAAADDLIIAEERADDLDREAWARNCDLINQRSDACLDMDLMRELIIRMRPETATEASIVGVHLVDYYDADSLAQPRGHANMRRALRHLCSYLGDQLQTI